MSLTCSTAVHKLPLPLSPSTRRRYNMVSQRLVSSSHLPDHLHNITVSHSTMFNSIAIMNLSLQVYWYSDTQLYRPRLIAILLRLLLFAGLPPNFSASWVWCCQVFFESICYPVRHFSSLVIKFILSCTFSVYSP